MSIVLKKDINFTHPEKINNLTNRDVAQSGSALDWGSRGRRFKSSRSDDMINSIFSLK